MVRMKLGLLLFLALLTMAAGSAAAHGPQQPSGPAAPAADSYEPDGTAGEAKEIWELDQQDRSISPAGDVDWAKLEIPPGEWWIGFGVNAWSPGQLRLELYDEDVNYLDGDATGDAIELSYDCADPLPSGLYYLRVDEVDGAELDDYTLAWDIYADCNDVELPDLEPYAYAEEGYTQPITPNSIRKTKTATTTLYAGKPTYFDWFFINNGPARPPGQYWSRIYVGGVPAIEQHENPIGQGSVGGRDDWSYTVLTPGWHTVRFETDADDDVAESDESNNVWQMDFYWEAVDGWWGEYFNNTELQGDPALVRDDPAIDFSWLVGSPGPGVNSDYFSVRWARTVNFAAGVYRFTLIRNDGMRFFVDGNPLLNKWEGVQSAITHVLIQPMTAGAHNLVLETMELEGHARASLSWERCYTLTANASAGGSVSPPNPSPNCGGQGYVAGTQVTLTPTADSGYNFTGWSGDAGGSANPLTVTMDSDKTITAQFAQIPCYTLTVTIDPPGSGNVSRSPSGGCAGGKYAAGTIVTLTPMADPGFVFSHWSGDAGGSATPLSVTMDRDKSITVHFDQIPCHSLTVAIDPPDGGNVNRTSANCGGEYTAGTVVTLTPIANTGYIFSHWSGVPGAANPLTVTMDGDKTITTHFVQTCYSLTTTAEPSGSGSVDRSASNCAGGKYQAGTVVTLTAVPAAGWHFSGWSGAVSGSDNPRTVTMNGDRAVVAHFTRECHTVTVVPDPAAGGVVDIAPDPNCNGTQYSDGTQITLLASAHAGYGFSHWSGAATGSINPRTLLIDADNTVTAHFIRPLRSGYMPSITFVPAAAITCLPGPGELEDNDEQLQATLPVCYGLVYNGIRNDLYDFYVINLTEAGEVTARLTTTSAAAAGVQLLLVYVGAGGIADIDRSLADSQQVGMKAQPGRYFVQVYTAKPDNVGYTLEVTFTPGGGQ